MNVLCFCSLQAGWSCVHFRRRPSLLRQHVTAISLYPRSKSDGGSFMPIPSVYFDKKSPILLHLLGILVTSAPTRNSHIPIFQGQKAIGGPILPYLHEQLKQKSMKIIFLVCTLLNCFAL